MLALAFRVRQRLEKIAGRCYIIAVDAQDHVTGLKAVLRSRSVWIDILDHQPLLASAGHFVRRRHGQPQMRNAAVGLASVVAHM